MNGVSTGEIDPGGWARRLISRLCGRTHPRPRLALLERITLAPRQSLALVEAEGRRFLVASSTEGAPAFFPLDDQVSRSDEVEQRSVRRRRMSW